MSFMSSSMAHEHDKRGDGEDLVSVEPGSMIIASPEQSDQIAGDLEEILSAADEQAAAASNRLSHEQVFASLRRIIGDSPL